MLVIDFWHPDLTIPEREALEWIYDFRNKSGFEVRLLTSELRFEQGKIKYVGASEPFWWSKRFPKRAWN